MENVIPLSKALKTRKDKEQKKEDAASVAITFVKARSGELRFNEVKGLHEYLNDDETDWLRITDKEVNSWCVLLKERSGVTVPNAKLSEYINSNLVSTFNPITEYFDKLELTDSTEFDKLISRITFETEAEWEYGRTALRKWLVGVVAVAYKRGQNHIVPVLVGGQGIGKTTLIRSLIPKELADCYSEGDIITSDKDTLQRCCDNFVVNLDEIESASKPELSKLKSLITTREMTIRRPYDRFAQTMYRYASFIASVNRTEFLSDTTGNRRWFPMTILGIDEGEIDVNALWGYAKSLLLSNYKYWYSREEAEAVEQHKSKYIQQTPERELLTNFFIPNTEENKSRGVQFFLTPSEMIQTISAIHPHVKIYPNRLGQELHSLGFEQVAKRVGGVAKRVYDVIRIFSQADIDERNKPF